MRSKPVVMIGSPMPSEPAVPWIKPRGRTRWMLLLASLAMGLLTLVLPTPGWAASAAPLAPSRPMGRLQESAPPQAVLQLQQELGSFQPQVTIDSPRAGTVLPAGPWELSLRIQDWPLVDAGTLGLGPHLVVQVDEQPPLRIATETDGVSITRSGELGADSRIVVDLPALAPGSHRITAYAARPWGEAVKSPGALSQIAVHRVAANPMALPAAGSPQLLPVSPADLSRAEPVLLDWLLLDAPLQNLRPGDGSWRLRITINGDSFLVDQNVPLWLRGWRPGSNSLLLELLDGLGEPLNPPFNSLVQEVDLGAGNSDGAPRPRWLQGRLNPDEIAVLLGRAAPADPKPPADPEPPRADDATRAPEASDDTQQSSEPAAMPQQSTEPSSETSTEQGLDEANAQTSAEPESAASEQPEPSDPAPPTSAPTGDAASTKTPEPPERITSSTPLGGTAREQVNADGSLIKPRASGPLAGLRQRIGA